MEGSYPEGGGLGSGRVFPKMYSNGGAKPKKPRYEPSPRKHPEGIDIDPKDYSALCSKFMMAHKNVDKGTLDTIKLNGNAYGVMADGEGSLIILYSYPEE